MYNDFEKWLDTVLEADLPEDAKGIGFNLYEDDENAWSIQLIATDTFDEEDVDWMCDEVFTTGEDLFSWKEDADWESVLEKGKALIQEYLEKGKYSDRLKDFDGIGVGFVDGDVEIVYKK